jgi:hypothetical protein
VEAVAYSKGMINLPRVMKLDLPKFGGENTSWWIYKANQYFKYYQVPSHEKIFDGVLSHGG